MDSWIGIGISRSQESSAPAALPFELGRALRIRSRSAVPAPSFDEAARSCFSRGPRAGRSAEAAWRTALPHSVMASRPYSAAGRPAPASFRAGPRLEPLGFPDPLFPFRLPAIARSPLAHVSPGLCFVVSYPAFVPVSAGG